jgi:hypothetical protein
VFNKVGQWLTKNFIGELLIKNVRNVKKQRETRMGRRYRGNSIKIRSDYLTGRSVGFACERPLGYEGKIGYVLKLTLKSSASAIDGTQRLL